MTTTTTSHLDELAARGHAIVTDPEDGVRFHSIDTCSTCYANNADRLVVQAVLTGTHGHSQNPLWQAPASLQEWARQVVENEAYAELPAWLEGEYPLNLGMTEYVRRVIASGEESVYRLLLDEDGNLPPSDAWDPAFRHSARRDLATVSFLRDVAWWWRRSNSYWAVRLDDAIRQYIERMREADGLLEVELELQRRREAQA